MHFESLFKMLAKTQTKGLTDCKKYTFIFDNEQLLYSITLS